MRPYEQTRNATHAYGPTGVAMVNGPSGLISRMENQGVIECTTFGGLDVNAPKEPDGRARYAGARGKDEPDYRGEVYSTSTSEHCQPIISRWSPSEVVVDADCEPGARIVLNQNWDSGWSADGEPTVAFGNLASTVLRSGQRQITFRYRPRTFTLACILTLAMVLGLTFGAYRKRRRTS
jgi:hypothetical protein